MQIQSGQVIEQLATREISTGGGEAMEVDQNGGVWLPEDVIFAVLSWLPARPLCRFRCVCKGWRALISSAAFIAAQKSRAAPLLVGVFLAPVPSDEPDEKHKHIHRLGFRKPRDDELRVMDADGNVLKVLRNVMMRHYESLLPTRLDLVCVDESGGGARVVDPATGGVVTVGRQVRGDGEHFWMCQTNRFGRAAASGAYKVVRLYDKSFRTEYDLRQFCDVATLGDGEAEPVWRQRPSPPFCTCWCAGCTVTINGVIYFLPRDECRRLYQVEDDVDDWNCIASFDLESEEWGEKMIHIPKLRNPKASERLDIELGELKGTLCMAETVRSSDLHDLYTNVDIWVLVDSERSIWVEEYTIQSPDSSFMVKPLQVLRDGRLLLLKTMDGAQREVYTGILQLYHPSTGAFTDLMVSREFRGMMTLYTGSILSQL